MMQEQAPPESHLPFLAPLEEGLSRCFARPVRIARLQARPLDAQSTYPIDRLEVTLDSRERVGVIFKRLRPEPARPGSLREVLVYRRLLADRRFGAPCLYASVLDEAQGRYWLFLEDVGPETLRHGDTPDWFAAVRWLARMHGTYLGREEKLRALGCLAEHDAGYYWSVAQGARDQLTRTNPPAVLARFERALARFPLLVSQMERQPRTLVHGDIFPDNIHLQPGGRVRPLDWESAALGVPAWDLARLLDGWGSDKPAFIKAYFAELAARTGKEVLRAAFRRTWRCCALLNVLWHIAWHEEPCQNPDFVASCLTKLEGISASLGAARPGEGAR
jgi:aminoglycoside/choline kinase family phosphotransferase